MWCEQNMPVRVLRISTLQDEMRPPEYPRKAAVEVRLQRYVGQILIVVQAAIELLCRHPTTHRHGARLPKSFGIVGTQNANGKCSAIRVVKVRSVPTARSCRPAYNLLRQHELEVVRVDHLLERPLRGLVIAECQRSLDAFPRLSSDADQ
jgi:hypothetical protein